MAADAELIESSTRHGELVVEPFAGSGATGVAAVLRGRRALLVEKEPKLAALTVNRVMEVERIAAEMRGCDRRRALR